MHRNGPRPLTQQETGTPYGRGRPPHTASPIRTLLGTLLLTLPLLAIVVLLDTGNAGAHATLQLYGSESAAGSYGHLFLRIPHGCDGRPTDTVTIAVPAGFTFVKPERKDGWKTQIGRNEKGRITSVTWYDGNLPDDHFEDFGLHVKYPTKTGTYHLPVVQRCAEQRIAWDQTTRPGENPYGRERPAPHVIVGSRSTHLVPGKALGETIGKQDYGEPGNTHRTGHVRALNFNGRTTVIADLPATLAGRVATITLETDSTVSGWTPTDGEARSSVVLSHTILNETGDLMQGYPNVRSGPGGWRIGHGAQIVITVAGAETARTVVIVKKKAP